MRSGKRHLDCRRQKGVGCDGFHPKVFLDVTKETRREIVEFLEKVEQSGKWPQQACTTMFFLIPMHVTSERPIARAKWRRAQRTVLDLLTEMERFNGRAKAEDQGAVALVLDLAKAFERVSLPVGLGLGDALLLPKKDLAGALRLL